VGRIKLACFIAGISSIIGIFTLTPAVSGDRIDIRGTVTDLSRARGESTKNVLGRVLVEGNKEADTQFDKANLTITVETKFFIKQNEQHKPASFDDLRKDQKVEAKITGPVKESYPVQAICAEILILP
jgi:hypothetical protein